jgi:hypothetical protein
MQAMPGRIGTRRAPHAVTSQAGPTPGMTDLPRGPRPGRGPASRAAPMIVKPRARRRLDVVITRILYRVREVFTKTITGMPGNVTFITAK